MLLICKKYHYPLSNRKSWFTRLRYSTAYMYLFLGHKSIVWHISVSRITLTTCTIFTTRRLHTQMEACKHYFHVSGFEFQVRSSNIFIGGSLRTKARSFSKYLTTKYFIFFSVDEITQLKKNPNCYFQMVIFQKISTIIIKKYLFCFRKTIQVNHFTCNLEWKLKVF